MAVRIFVVRHAEREDHINQEWQHQANRVHDPPLSQHGKDQCNLCGEHIFRRLSQLYNLGPSPNSKSSSSLNGTSAFSTGATNLKQGRFCFTVLSSPLIRCVITTKLILQSLQRQAKLQGKVAESLNDIQKAKIKIEQGLCEHNSFLRGRMMATHKDTCKINKLTGKRRGLCDPVLLGPSDLMETALPSELDLEYKTILKVDFDEDGYEVDAESLEKIQNEKRLEIFLSRFTPSLNEVALEQKLGEMSLTERENGDLEETAEDKVFLFVTHGTVGKNLINILTEKENEELKPFDYCKVAEVTRGRDGGKFYLDNCWVLDEFRKQHDVKLE